MEIINEKNGIPEIYKYYEEEMIHEGKRFRAKKKIFKDKYKYLIHPRTFSNILKDFNLEIARMILEENLEFRMPASMGTVRVRKYKKRIKFNEDGTVDRKNTPINWKASKDLWAKEYPGLSPEELKQIKGKPMVYYLNEHTEGYVFRLYWNKRNCAIKGKKHYSAVFTRTNNRRISELIRADPNINYYT